MSFISGKGFTTFDKKSSTNGSPMLPYDPNDEDLGPSVSMAVMAENDQDFKKSTFGIKRTTSVGKFGIKTNQLSSLSSNNLDSQGTKSYSSHPLTPPSNEKPSNTTALSNDLFQYSSPAVQNTPLDISLSYSPEPPELLSTSASNNKTNYSNEPVYFQPRDDVDLSQEPSTHVDYFSHNWDESDISKSWKYIILQKKKKHTENKDDNIGLIHHDHSYSRSGSIVSPSGTPQPGNFKGEKHASNEESASKNEISESLKLTNQQQDLEIDMDAVNAARLENASWRTWAKARNNLKTVSPELVNWCKESDITWLYGPIVPGDKNKAITAPPSNDSDECVSKSANDTSADPHKGTVETKLKPILKKRTVTEIIERNAKWKLDQIKKNYMKNHGGKLPSHRLEDTSDLRSYSPAPFGADDKTTSFVYPHEDYKALAAKVNAQYHKKSDMNIQKKREKSDDSLKNRKMVMAKLLSTDKSPTDDTLFSSNNFKGSYQSGDAKNTGTADNLSYDSNHFLVKDSYLPKKKHIRFNDRVEQCIAIMPEISVENINQKTGRGSSDEEDMRRIRKRSKIVLPSGITLGTGNGGSSDESSSDEEIDEFDVLNFNDSMTDSDQPQFIENNTVKDVKPNYSLGNTRYYRGPALPDSDSSDEEDDDEEKDDIFAGGKTSQLGNTNHTASFSSGGLFIDSVRPKHFPHGLSNTPPARTIERPAISKLYSEPVTILSKPKYPPAIKRLAATCLNYKNEDTNPNLGHSNTGSGIDFSFGNDIRSGNVLDSHGYNNYDYNSVCTKGYILNNNEGVNVVDVPSQFAPSSSVSSSDKQADGSPLTNAAANNFFVSAKDIMKKSNNNQDFDVSSGMATKGTLSRTSSATSGLAKGFAANLTLNPSSSNVSRPNFISGKAIDDTPAFFQNNLKQDIDSDDDSDNERLSFSSSRSASFAALNQHKPFNSFLNDNNKNSSSIFQKNSPVLNSEAARKNVSFISGNNSSSSSQGNLSLSSTADFGEPLSKVLSRSCSQVNAIDATERFGSSGRFTHNIKPPPKKSFSFFDDGNDSDSD